MSSYSPLTPDEDGGNYVSPPPQSHGIDMEIVDLSTNPSAAAPAPIALSTFSSSVSQSGDDVSCRICRLDDDPDKLIQPCQCSGSLRNVHCYCLEEWIRTRPMSAEMRRAEAEAERRHRDYHQRENEDSDQESEDSAAAPLSLASSLRSRFSQFSTHFLSSRDPRLQCEICHSPYQMNLSYQFQCQRTQLLSCRSISHTIELLILVLILLFLALSWPFFLNKDENQPNGTADRVIFPFFTIGLFFLAIYTIARVFQRWKRANSVIRILPNPGSAGSVAQSANALASSEAHQQTIAAQRREQLAQRQAMSQRYMATQQAEHDKMMSDMRREEDEEKRQNEQERRAERALNGGIAAQLGARQGQEQQLAARQEGLLRSEI